jgi:hypothetical protein
MDITVRELDQNIVNDLNKVDDEFSSMLNSSCTMERRTIGLYRRSRISAHQAIILLTTVINDYVNNPDRTAFLAYVNGR